jgi:hypothetical protein
MDNAEEERESEEEEEEAQAQAQAQAQAALRQLLEHSILARRAEALALLDLQPGLLNLHWAGQVFRVNDKYAWTNTTALIAAGKGGDLALVLALLERGADLHARDSFNRTALIGAAYWSCLLYTSPSPRD